MDNKFQINSIDNIDINANENEDDIIIINNK